MNLFMFPGQGSQSVGMGADAIEFCREAKDVFAEVDDAISFKISDVIFNGTEEDLRKTENAQVALMATSMAYMRALNHIGIDVDGMVAGHSLGEYTALCASGVLSLRDTAKLLWVRGNAMKDCATDGFGMLAVIGLGIEAVNDVIASIDTDEFVEVANDNSGIQVVVSGSIRGLEIVADAAKKAGAMKTVMLNVSGPFHSSMMKPAAERLEEALDRVTFNAPKCPIIANYTANAETSGFRDLLLNQLINKVRWRESIQFAKANGVTRAIEVGPGKVLTGLVKRIEPSIELVNINSIENAIALSK